MRPRTLLLPLGLAGVVLAAKGLWPSLGIIAIIALAAPLMALLLMPSQGRGPALRRQVVERLPGMGSQLVLFLGAGLLAASLHSLTSVWSPLEALRLGGDFGLLHAGATLLLILLLSYLGLHPIISIASLAPLLWALHPDPTRITSYNVCYTKLLRPPGRAVGRPAVRWPGASPGQGALRPDMHPLPPTPASCPATGLTAGLRVPAAELDALAWRSPGGCDLSEAQRSWLLDEGSLTGRLRAQGRGFSLRLLGEGWIERASVPSGLGAGPYWERQVLLCLDHRPWVWGRTLMPAASLQACPELGALGSQPLGERLFRHPDLTRGTFELADFSASPAFCRALESWGRNNFV